MPLFNAASEWARVESPSTRRRFPKTASRESAPSAATLRYLPQMLEQLFVLFPRAAFFRLPVGAPCELGTVVPSGITIASFSAASFAAASSARSLSPPISPSSVIISPSSCRVNVQSSPRLHVAENFALNILISPHERLAPFHRESLHLRVHRCSPTPFLRFSTAVWDGQRLIVRSPRMSLVTRPSAHH